MLSLVKKSAFFTSGTSWDEIYLVFSQKSKFSFFYILNRKILKAQPNFFLGCFTFSLTFSVCLLGITLGGNNVCLKLYFKE